MEFDGRQRLLYLLILFCFYNVLYNSIITRLITKLFNYSCYIIVYRYFIFEKSLIYFLRKHISYNGIK